MFKSIEIERKLPKSKDSFLNTLESVNVIPFSEKGIRNYKTNINFCIKFYDFLMNKLKIINVSIFLFLVIAGVALAENFKLIEISYDSMPYIILACALYVPILAAIVIFKPNEPRWHRYSLSDFRKSIPIPVLSQIIHIKTKHSVDFCVEHCSDYYKNHYFLVANEKHYLFCWMEVDQKGKDVYKKA